MSLFLFVQLTLGSSAAWSLHSCWAGWVAVVTAPREITWEDGFEGKTWAEILMEAERGLCLGV